MPSLPRILVVDAHGILSDLVRSSMVLLDRRCILIEVPGVDDALNEITNADLNLIVTTFTLDDDFNGLELAERAIREQAGAAVIIVADEFDEPIDPRALVGKPFQYLEYPPGDDFLRAIRIGLDGEEVVQVEEGSAASLDIGPIPNINVEEVRQVLVNTIIETGAMGGMVCDRAGRVLIDEGATGYVDKSVVAAGIGPSFPQAVRIGPQIGGTGWSMKYYDGERYDLFAMALGYHHFAVLIFDGAERAAFGVVTRFGRQGVDQMIAAIGEEAWTYEEAVVIEEVVEPGADEVEPVAVVEKRRTSAFARDEVLADALAEAEEAEASPDMEPFLEPVGDLDIDRLLGDDVDDSDADALFGGMDEDALDLGLGDNVSFDEAQDMGLLGD